VKILKEKSKVAVVLEQPSLVITTRYALKGQ